MIDLMNIQENKVTNNLNQYPIILTSLSGDGKTTTMKKIAEELSNDGRKPLFIMFEDRYQHIPGIMAVRIHNMGELSMVQSQLMNPALKEKFSCVVFDTVDRLDSMIEKNVADSKGVQISGDLGYGKGNKYIKSTAQFIYVIKDLGWTTHFIVQMNENKDINTGAVTYEPKVNKEIWNMIYQDCYLCGFLKVGSKGERTLTFKKSSEFPKLKDSIGLPKDIKIDEFKKVFEKAVTEMAGGQLTDEDTISVEYKDARNFDEIKKRGMELGNILAQKGFLNEATFILAQTIGVDENEKPKSFDSLIPAQVDIADVCVQKLEDLAKQKGIEI